MSFTKSVNSLFSKSSNGNNLHEPISSLQISTEKSLPLNTVQKMQDVDKDAKKASIRQTENGLKSVFWLLKDLPAYGFSFGVWIESFRRGACDFQ